jgi:hypothetical protein
MKKKLLAGLAVGMMMGAMVGTANAAPMTWTDNITLDPSQKLTWGQSLTFNHDITDGVDGFNGILMGGNDIITDYSILLSLHDDGGLFDGWEIAWVDTPGVIADGFYNFTASSDTFGWSVAGIVDLNTAGMLDITVTSLLGDFYVDSSVLTANGENGCSAPVPEPATMLLFGTGLAGLIGAGRRQKK